jgi:hypothetical protein
MEIRMNDSRHPVIRAVASIILFATLFSAFAQELLIEDTSARCIPLRNIQDIEILDERNIIFRVSVNNFYLNTLPYRCVGLRRNDTIMYRTSINEICDVDVITVLDDIGPGFQAGVSCGLGRFRPINEEEIKMLRDLIQENR